MQFEGFAQQRQCNRPTSAQRVTIERVHSGDQRTQVTREMRQQIFDDAGHERHATVAGVVEQHVRFLHVGQRAQLHHHARSHPRPQVFPQGKVCRRQRPAGKYQGALRPQAVVGIEGDQLRGLLEFFYVIQGKALQIHPLVCTAFNADFDGDQMAIHVPLSAEAQAEARVLMLSANNILSPASGRPIVTPSQDLIIGGYWLTESMKGVKGEGRVFRNMWEVLRALDEGSLHLHAEIVMRRIETLPTGESKQFTTTAGRLQFEEALPADYAHRFGHINAPIKKREMGLLVERLSDHYGKADISQTLDDMKAVCYRYATQSGLTVSIEDVKTPKKKREILDGYEAQADKVETQFRRGIITDGERRQQEVRIWTDATAEVQSAMEKEFKAQRWDADKSDWK